MITSHPSPRFAETTGLVKSPGVLMVHVGFEKESIRIGYLSSWKIQSWWARQDSNLRPTGYEPAALTSELRARRCRFILVQPQTSHKTRHRKLSGCLARLPPGRRTR